MITRMNRRHQIGSMGGWILAILFFGSAMSLGSKLIPLYMDHNTMSTILDKLGEEPGLSVRSDTELKSMIKKRFRLNNIREFDIEEHVEFDRSRQNTSIVMDYEVRMPVIHNIDMIASFNKQVELKE